MSSSFALHPEAFQDIDDIWEFIAKDSPDTADRVVDDIFAALATLVSSPHLGHPRSDLTSRPLRFWRVRDYLIAYAPEERLLWVLAVIHGRRNPRILAAILQRRG